MMVDKDEREETPQLTVGRVLELGMANRAIDVLSEEITSRYNCTQEPDAADRRAVAQGQLDKLFTTALRQALN